MGADVHMHLEGRLYPHDDKNKQNGKWISLDTFQVNPYYFLYPEEYKEDDSHALRYQIPHDSRIYTGRNYALFGILAGVRWNSPIAFNNGEPKGMPADVSYHTMGEAIKWEGDAHSHSWLTLEELENFDWHYESEQTEYLHSMNENAMAIYQQLKQSGKVIDERDENGMYIVKAMVPLSHIVGEFYTETIPKMKQIAERKLIDHKDLRLVFWFDN